MLSLRAHCMLECSSDLTTEVYESCSAVYLPTRTMLTLSKRRSWLQQGQQPGLTQASDARNGESLPPRHQLDSSLDPARAHRELAQLQALLEVLDQALLLE